MSEIVAEPIRSLEQLVTLAKRRGFYFPSSEIYGGGTSGVVDRGPLGVELANNIKKLWWQRFVRERDDMVGLDAAILTAAPVLTASGHVDSFTDPLIECSNCHIRLRADHYLEEGMISIWIKRWVDEATRQRGTTSKKDADAALEAAQAFFDLSDPEAPVAKIGVNQSELCCPNPSCRKTGTYGEPRFFNMMFKTQLGAVEGASSDVYLRPETAQGIFVNFKNIVDTSRVRLPFGIAQIGKAFRNEITVGNSLFRMRELEQMEIEYFVKPGEDEAIHQEWIDRCQVFLAEDLGLNSEHFHAYEHSKEKLSHYSKRTVDFEYDYPFGRSELHGIANRTDFDLSQHQKHSGKDLTYFDDVSRERFIPYVIEPSLGVDRSMLAVLCDAYREYPKGRDGSSTEVEIVLHLAKQLAPVSVAILPLMKKDGLAEKAQDIYKTLRRTLAAQYDDGGAIGRRYRRQDEIGTPYCVTVDYQTLEDATVTVRDRDTMEQVRVPVAELSTWLATHIQSN